MKKNDFDNYIHVSHQSNSQVFSQMVYELDKEFNFRMTQQAEDFTGPAFTTLYQITNNFYRTYFPNLYKDFIPLYLAVWKVRVKDTIGINNMHQDGGIQYFAKNLYQSQMVNLWTNLHKDYIPSLSDSDLGIFVIDNKDPDNQELYEKMVQKNTHFYQRSSKELYDIRQIGDAAISYELDSLKKLYFDYSEGTTIQFNSHLLHGTKSLEKNKLHLLHSDELNKYRATLTSVWVHQRDFNHAVLEIKEEDYEQIYLSEINKKDRNKVKSLYYPFCQKEVLRLRCIMELIRTHFLYNNPSYQ